MRSHAFAAAIVAILAASPALAQPRLVSSQPAEAAKAADVRAIALTFSEKLALAQSGFALTMTGMPGMSNHAPMKVSGFTPQLSPDGKTLGASLPRALPAGSYELAWSATGADGEAAKGVIRFSVR